MQTNAACDAPYAILPMEQVPPLVVDLDGTLTPTDTLVEMVIRVIKQSPLTMFFLPIWLLRGIAYFKARVAGATSFSAPDLPYRDEFVQFLTEQKAGGRRLVLATAAHESIGHAVAAHLRLFDQVIGSNSTCNLKGKRKLAAIREQIGDVFVYAGDSNADLPIWRVAHAAVLVNMSNGLFKLVKQSVPIERSFSAVK